MAVIQTFTDEKTGANYPDAYRHIRIKDYSEHKSKVIFTLKSYASQARYEANLKNPNQHKLDCDKHFMLRFFLEDESTPNPVFDQYLGNLSQSGKDLIGQLYEYLKNETTELAGAVDVL